MSTANGNQSVEKTLRIIETLAKAPQPLRLIELSEHVNMPSSTVFRMLNTLIDMGYAYQEDAGLRRYALTTRFLYIGQMAADHSDFQGLVHPYIQELSNNLREMSCVAVMRNNKLRYIDVVENANNRITVPFRVHRFDAGRVYRITRSSRANAKDNYPSRPIQSRDFKL